MLQIEGAQVGEAHHRGLPGLGARAVPQRLHGPGTRPVPRQFLILFSFFLSLWFYGLDFF
jgi:hypothetical protein